MPRIIVKDHKYYFKIRGLGGPKGDKGDTGPAGPQGPQGPYVNVVAGTTTTLPAGSSAQVTVNNIGNTSTLNFGIPQGTKGDKGDAGTPGAQGPRGFAATVNVGETTTGQPGTNASVVNAGNEHDAVLKFTIPRGEKGETGETGPQGPTGGVKSTVVAELPEDGESDKYYLVYRDSEGGTITTTDGRAQITNDENGGDLTVSQLLGNAEQTTYSGRNLLKLGDGEATAVGISVPAVSDNSITVKAESGVGAYNSRSYDIIGLQPGQQYTVSCNISGAYSGANGATVRIDNGHTGGASAILGTLNTTNPTLTFTVPEGSEKLGIYFYVAYGQTPTVGSTATFTNIQLEKGSTATAYEPYVGGIHAPNPDYPQPISTVTGAQTITVTGKNLWNNLKPTAKSASATWTPTDNGGTFVNPNAWGTGLVWNFNLDTTQQYTVQLSTPSDRPLYFYVRSYTDDTYTTESTRIVHEARGNISRTFQPDTPYVRLFFWNGQVINDGVTVQNMMLELGSTATAYEPYQGQSYEINLGKNLFDASQSLEYKWLSSVDGSLVGSLDKNIVSDYIRVKIGQPYTISGIGSLQFNVWSYDTSSSATGKTHLLHNSTTVRTITPDTNYIRFSVGGGDATAIKNDIQFEAGTQATAYAPYFTPIELAKIGNYQDRIYKSDGKWYIEKQVGKLVLSGSEGDITWSLTTTGSSYSFWFRNNTVGIKTTEHPKLCDRFTYSADPYTTAPTPSLCENLHPNYDGGYMTIFKVDSTIATTIDGWKAWLASHPTTVYYALATPTTTEITDETLLLQLNFLASLYKGENNISLIGTGAQGELTGNYVVYDKYNRHKVYIWSSDDNTWQIIVQ